VRFLYNLLTYFLLLPYAAYWFVRALMNPIYRHKIWQRFGAAYPELDQCIWIHAVSVGEVVAAAPLVRALQRLYPELPLLVTTVTPTGAARVASLFGDDVHHAYIPFEMPIAINSFFRSTKPQIALVMETEIWPNLYHGCGVRRIPLVLISARISPKSVDSYRKLLPLFKETLSHGIVIAAQSKADAERFISLGASTARTRVTGNIKFDIELPEGLAESGAELRERFFPGRPVWIAASTHDNEEKIVLDAHDSLLQTYPSLLLILVPRHPGRFLLVREFLDKEGFTAVSRTEQRPCSTETQVLLVDTMGEVTLFYAASDVAFVGGSLVPVGGHNLLEPAALGVPIITGPHVFNAQEIADSFVKDSACRMVADSSELAATVSELLANKEKARELGANGLNILNSNRGALRRLLDVIEPLLAKRSD
jgi:3-deoxy-D-manno-octulosonic-acid transferase